MSLNAYSQSTRGKQVFFFYAWGYASRKRLRTAGLEWADKLNSITQKKATISDYRSRLSQKWQYYETSVVS